MSLHEGLVLGIDVGSTTVKIVVVDPLNRAIVWSDYRRHETRQAATLEAQLGEIASRFDDVPTAAMRAFVTGSGAAPLAPLIGAKFVQEVNAVTLAVDALHPDVGSVIELGGQDAKIIIYKPAPPGADAADRRVIASMNDKCASGTGATIDKCVMKVGLPAEALATLAWNPDKLHPVAAKCGVFAETDIVGLIKSGIPAAELMCSLADAIVAQNLSVLARGHTLQPRVLLLGGPNTYLPFLQACWQQRIVELWQSRGHAHARDMPPEALVFVPDNAALYAAYGAAVYGLQEPGDVGRYGGLEGLRTSLSQTSRDRALPAQGPALVQSDAERDAFIERFRMPAFVPAVCAPDSVVEGYVGIDGGSTSSKAVLLDQAGGLLFKHYQLSQGNPVADAKEIFARLRDFAVGQGATLKVLGLGATGYAADILEETIGADANIVETVAHMMAAQHSFDDVDVVCDVGGQDIKVLFIANGDIRNFRLSNQCSAGNGMLLQAMASQFGVAMQDYAALAFQARMSPQFNYGCAVFLDTDRVTFQKEGYGKEELMAGLALVLPKNIWQYVVQLPRLAQLGRVFVLQGGTQHNLAAVKAQHDYIAERVPGAVVRVHPHCGEAGAIGAALEARRVVERRGASRFVGLESAIGLAYTTRNDQSTVCHFCVNACKRSFIDAVTPTGKKSRYIAGFSCENGTVESKDALKALVSQRRSLKAQFPNLVDYEAELAFKSVHRPDPLPVAGTPLTDVRLRRSWKSLYIGMARRPYARGFERSCDQSQAHRAGLRVGMPRVLNLYSTAPLFRAYFEALGIDSRNIVFSDSTSEPLWEAGSRYGSIDPCFPSKVTQAHIHDLLMVKHKARPLDFIFFPCLTHLPSFVQGMSDTTACPIVAGVPKVMRAAFTKEVDHFAQAGVEYIDPAITLNEPNYMKSQMFTAWGEGLRVTRDESDFALEQGLSAMRAFDSEMQRRGLLLLEQLEDENRVGILMLGRPYHNDPGLNHGVLDEFQALGYPVLSIRSIPKDPRWLARFFGDEAQAGETLRIADVWPEAYSTNSAEKVWAAKFAARHPHLVVLDFSSFKCGHDAPTYGMIDDIIGASATPYSALHDIDANKPSGSIKIRVRTYAHALQRHTEKLQDLQAARSELARRIDEKRRELRASHRREAQPRHPEMPDALDEAYAAYLSQEKPIVFAPPEPTHDRACATTTSNVHPIIIFRSRPGAPDSAGQRRQA
jgi:activator of 2-hydroxyglutaryl-CoA dehydratase/predicted nucleotide-binding protein (sugar kinase/HSP70/actin superfamily)